MTAKTLRQATSAAAVLCALAHAADPARAEDISAQVRLILSGAFEGRDIRPWLEQFGEVGRAAVRELAQESAPGEGGTSPIVRENAVRAIGLFQDPQGLGIVIALSHGKDSGLRRAAIYALGRLGSPAALQELRAQLNEAHEDPQAAFIVRALADGGDASDIQRLREFLAADTRPYIGREVERATDRLRSRLQTK